MGGGFNTFGINAAAWEPVAPSHSPLHRRDFQYHEFVAQGVEARHISALSVNYFFQIWQCPSRQYQSGFS